MQDGKTLVTDEIKFRMNKMGYKCSMALLTASDYGVSQNRQRLIIIGVDNDYEEFDFKSLDLLRDELGIPSRSKENSVELTLGATIAGISKSIPNRDDIWHYSPGSLFMVEKIGFCKGGVNLSRKLSKSSLLRLDYSDYKTGRSWKNIEPKILPPRFKRIHDNPEKYHAPNFYRRFGLGEICGTITASAQPENCGITHPLENRRFSIREIARIQSFPDNFVFCGSATKQIVGSYKVIGNAVPPVLGWMIARALQIHLTKN
jgi:DNA (cytosine-5)-methyltransferase 1